MKTRRRRYAPFLLCLAPLPSVVGAQDRFDETVVVTGSTAPTSLGETGRALSIVTKEEIAELPVLSLADAVRVAPWVQVRARGEQGMQTDFSLRGATFAQTLVLVDGVRVNDAQTGHHNGDIPVPLDDVERIEILYGPGSAQHGADAFGGIINVLTRRDRPRVSARGTAGSFGFLEGALGARFGGEDSRAGVSIGGRRSDGFTEDRDFASWEARGDFTLGSSTRVTLAHLDKEFGAKGFYGPAPSREWTAHSLATVDRGFGVGARTAGSVQAFARRHSDRFVYDVTRPELSDNTHYTATVGVLAKLHRHLAAESRLSVGTEAAHDWIDSTSLGEDGYGRLALFAELQQGWGAVTLTPGLRLTAHSGFESALSPSLAITGPVNEAVRWRVSGGHAFRVPTYIELRYRDPNHMASGDLDPERSWGVDAGLDLATLAGWQGSVSLFARWDASVIDWVRDSPDERWHTANIRDVATAGVEVGLRKRLSGKASVGVHYTYLDSRADELDQLSKYLLDFARHAAGADLWVTLPRGAGVASAAQFRRQADGRTSWLLDLRLSQQLGAVELFADGSNLLDSRTQEIVGVDVPGRSFSFGVRARLP